MPHYSLPTAQYANISSIRLSTRSALPHTIPSSAHISDPPRPQYDTMKSYSRLEKAGTIANMESQQRNVRPLFSYPRRDFQTPRKNFSRKEVQRNNDDGHNSHVPFQDEDTSALLSSSLIDSSNLLDSIFSSSPTGEQGGFFSSPPTSMMDFSSSLPYPSEQIDWGSSPPIRLPNQSETHCNNSSLRHIPTDLPGYRPPARIFLSNQLEQELWRGSPPTLQPTSSRSHVAQHRRGTRTSLLPSNPSLLTIPESEESTPQGHISGRPSPSRSSDFTIRQRQRRTFQRMTSSPSMRYVTVLDDISEDEQALVEEVVVKTRALSRRSRLGLKIDRIIQWVFRR